MMKKLTQILSILFFGLTLSACSTFATKANLNNNQAQWDFDHSVQFRQVKLASTRYQLEIIPNNKVKFERLATFLLRQSYRLCGHYGYTLEVLQGIEEFDDKFTSPNRIVPSLIATVNCPVKRE